VRVAGKVEPVFVDTVAEIPDAARAIARDGDVVLTMGAGSIGSVAGQIARPDGEGAE
jgi:UDP-N-acetylmuramate--alanine ligase